MRSTPAGRIALEIEWNNKDPFFDRDLENFKRLHAEGAISAGVIVTRGATLHDGMETIIGDFAVRHGIASFGDLWRFEVEPTRRQLNAVDQRMRTGRLGFEAVWPKVFCADKFGEATTHWKKLQERVRRGVGNPCPLLLIGIPASVVTP